MKKNFINTTDKETAKLLREMGFEELPKNGDVWVFVNDTDDKITFSSRNMKIAYTDVLAL